MTGVQRRWPSLEEARALGQTLTAVDDALLRPVTGSTRRWWTGAEPYLTITIDDDDDGCVFVEVCLRGRFARRTRGGRVETGTTDELAPKPGRSRTPLERRDRPDDVGAGAVVAVARAVLEGAGLILASAWFAAESMEDR